MRGKRIYKLSMLSVVVVIVVIGLFVKCRSVEEKGLAELKEGILATVNGENITEEEFEKSFSGLTGDEKRVFENDREGFLNEMIRRRCLAQEAVRRGLDKRAGVAEEVKGEDISKKEALLIEALMKDVTSDIVVDEGEIKKFYEEHRA
ncbi:MAG: SurA N-terminal domain-containing protein, partial [Planctomycetota bacterium]|nr:SurA N-terminal domain-containing protein [Planctomycetota bacterium]